MKGARSHALAAGFIGQVRILPVGVIEHVSLSEPQSDLVSQAVCGHLDFELAWLMRRLSD